MLFACVEDSYSCFNSFHFAESSIPLCCKYCTEVGKELLEIQTMGASLIPGMMHERSAYFCDNCLSSIERETNSKEK